MYKEKLHDSESREDEKYSKPGRGNLNEQTELYIYI